MSKEQMLDKILHAFTESSGVEEVKKLVSEALESNSPFDVMKTMNEGLDVVGKKYEKGEFFLSELIMAGVMATEVTSILKPHLLASKHQSKGKVVIGTVKGDIHDIGKNIVRILLEAAGFEVIDLGKDVSTSDFINAVNKYEPQIVGLSTLMSPTMLTMEATIAELNKQSLRNKFKIIVGGAPVTEEYANEIGADGYAEDAIDAITVTKALSLKEGKSD